MKYDVIVGGAGSAGAILASRLSENPRRSVLLLEAGPDYPDFDHLPDDVKFGYDAGTGVPPMRTPGGHPVALASSIHNWKFVAKATDLSPEMAVPRGKVTGGSSAINSSAFYRGIPEDFEAWVAEGNDQWSFEKVLPYFRLIETDVDHDEHYGSDGPIFVHHLKREGWHATQTAFYNACVDAGYPETPDHNEPGSQGVGPAISNNLNRIRFSTSLGYLSQSRHRLNLTIRANCTARRLLLDGRRATGVEVDSGGDMFAVESDQVILSAGAVGSPHLLMLSGVGPSEHLTSLGIPVVLDLPGVGQNLKDHPKLYVTWRIKGGYPVEERPARGGVSFRFTATGSHLRSDLGISMGSFVTPRLKPQEYLSPRTEGNDLTARRVEMVVGLLLPVSSGHLKLTSADPNVQPYLDYNYLSEPFDRERLREAVRLCLKLAEYSQLVDVIGERIEPLDADLESDVALDRWMMQEAHTYSHISCTCKMGPATDPMAVTDQFGNIHGMEGLRIVDASIMPDLVRAPINPTVLMIGERIADLIR